MIEVARYEHPSPMLHDCSGCTDPTSSARTVIRIGGWNMANVTRLANGVPALCDGCTERLVLAIAQARP